jgi:DNA ligase (NAD+)
MKKTVKKIKRRLIFPKNKTIKKIKRRLIFPKNINHKIENNINNNLINKKTMRQNENFIKILSQLSDLLKLKGQYFRSRAYQKAIDSIVEYKNDITSTNDIKNLKGVGKTIIGKLDEYVKTGKVKILEEYKNSPIYIFSNIYGVGPKKAKELVDVHNISTIKQLRDKQDELLNDKQKIGLKHYEDILKRIPRKEIELYNTKLKKIFKSVANKDSTFQIVGSYRRGASNSGDIDIIICDPNNDVNVFHTFLDKIIEEKILIEVLSRGDVKSLGVSKLRGKPARRIDFMFTPRDEYAFAILYFTGSKDFNTIMRGHALKKGYSMNEHGMYKMVNKKKGAKLKKFFQDEQSIFDFLGMEYKKPEERIGSDSFVLKKKTVKKLKNITLKKTPKKYNKIVNSYLENGINELKKLDEIELSKLIRLANKGYYCNNKPVMTDAQYDMLKEYIEEKYPDNEAIKEGHTQCILNVEKTKVKLPYEMWSLDKEKTEKGVQNKVKKYKGDWVISAKADGISILYVCDKGEKHLYSRGNGTYGQDLSFMIPYLNLPDYKCDNKTIVIRGELIVQKSKFNKKYKKQFANPRNFVSGIANSKKSNTNMIKDLDLLAYEVIEPKMIPSKQMEFMVNHFKDNTIKHEKVKDSKVTTEYLSKKLLDWRENYSWEIDGIVVSHDKIHPRTTGNPKHAFAFKMVLSDQIVESRVHDVLWSPSKDGYLKPKIQIEPVKIGGAKITYATAHNAAFVYGKNYENPEEGYIGPGAIIQIIRSGDVIPKVYKVIAPAFKPKDPPSIYKYKWNKNGIDFILDDKDDNEIVQMKRISAFFEKIEVAGLGRGNVKRIMQKGFNTVAKIISMSYEDFLSVEGFKEKMATKIHTNIKNAIDKTPIYTLMAGSNIFGRGMGERRIKIILKEYPDILLSKKSEKEKIKMVADLSGFQQKTALTFVPHIDKFMKFAKEIGILNRIKTINQQKYDTSHPLYKKNIVFTGVRDKNLQTKLETIGSNLTSSVSKNTFVVIVKDMDEFTTKADKAQELGVPIQTIDGFKKKYFK